MLSAEAAAKHMEAWLLPTDDEKRTPAVVTDLAKLPKRLRTIGYGLFELDENGKEIVDDDDDVDWRVSWQRRNAPLQPLDDLSPKERRQLFGVLFGRNSESADDTWELLKQVPYQINYACRAFRAPHNPSVTFEARSGWLRDFATGVAAIQPGIVTPQWLAIWGSYQNAIGEVTAGRFLAAAINRDDATGREVFEILCQSVRNEHEVAGMSYMAVRALQMSNRTDGWELIERTLLAAQRQEGLRQTILQTVDEAHPEAFRRMLKMIQQEKLARFSAVTCAVNDWFRLSYESNQLKQVNESIDRALQFLEQPSARTKALHSSDPEEVYFALWATGYEDAFAGIAAAEKTYRHINLEVRYVTVYFLRQLGLPEAAAVLVPMLKDDDLHVALTALDGLRSDDSDDSTAHQQRFELIELLLQRMPEKPKKLPAIVWPWTERAAEKSRVADVLVSSLGTLPPTRLLPYLSVVGRYKRVIIVRMLAEQKAWDQLTRETLLQLTGNPSADVRQAAIDGLSRVSLTKPEILFIEGLLNRKASDLRIGALKLLSQQTDHAAIESAGRLLDSKDSFARLGGLELLRKLMAGERERKACFERANKFAATATKKTNEELTQLQAILETPVEQLTLDNALGLIDPADLTAVPSVTAQPVVFFTDATLAILKSLDKLVHLHREAQVTVKKWDDTESEEVFGTLDWLPGPTVTAPPEGQSMKLPLAEVWEDWFRNRPTELRDPDGLELIRVERFLGMPGDSFWSDVCYWAAPHPDRQAWVVAYTNGKQPVSLEYGGIVRSIVDWLLFLHRPAGVEDFLLDAAETWLALVPQSCNDELLRFAQIGVRASQCSFRGREPVDWRIQYSAYGWYDALSKHWLYSNETPEQLARRWKLASYLNQPVPGASRCRPNLQLLLAAHHAGLTSLADVTDAFLGPRNGSGYDSFRELNNVLCYSPDSEDDRILAELPDILALADRCRERVLEIELARADTPTPATEVAHWLPYRGVNTLGRLLRAIGANGFKLANRYGNDAKMARLPTLTDMASRCRPISADTQAAFDREIEDCLAAGLNEQSVLELMFLAPQWTKFVSNYFQWPGLSEGLYWFLAHMKSINADAESAATAGGYVADQFEEGKDNSQNQSAWQRLVAERTVLSDAERAEGAIDVEWFHKVYAQLTPKRWEALAAAARFAANPAQAKRATYLGEVLLGKANRKELFAAVTQKKLKDSVRLIGLYPLAGGAKRVSDLAQRYKMLVDYRRYAKTLSSLTKPAAMQALEIGFRNLASTAGYVDPLRLEWAMEADAIKDLAKGPVSAGKNGVVVTLALDDFGKLLVTTERNGKPLKSVPADVKKDKRVAEMLDRVGDIRRQASRVKESLEAAMCRGDEFEPEELVQLCQHALLKPLLSRLVIVADDRMGFPDKGGKSLRDHAGKQQAILKKTKLRLAHPVDLFQRGDWAKWQHECFETGRVQPFKQIFRELYLVTKQERKDGTRSSRYAGQQVNPQQANALWNARNWHTEGDVFKAFPAEGITASVSFRYGGFTPLEVEGLTFDTITFQKRDQFKPLKLSEVPPRLLSEVMRDLDLVVSVAHRGGVDPEATASTVEMREALVQETCLLLGLKNVKIKQPRVLIKGQLAEYAIHLGSGNVHRMPGGALCVIPVHAQHRGRLFLPFADDDPRTAEIVSKILLLAKDHEIQDPSILDQLR